MVTRPERLDYRAGHYKAGQHRAGHCDQTVARAQLELMWTPHLPLCGGRPSPMSMSPRGHVEMQP